MPESFEAASENRHRGCGCDMLRLIVPSSGSSNREGPIDDNGQSCMTDSQRQWGSGAEVSPGLRMSHAAVWLAQKMLFFSYFTYY